MRRRSVEPAGSRRADLRRGLASPTPTVAAALAGPGLTHNPSRTTVDPENGGYLGDVGLEVRSRSSEDCHCGRGATLGSVPSFFHIGAPRAGSTWRTRI